MASTTFQIFKVPDEELIHSFETIASDCGTPDNINVNFSFGQGHNQPITGNLVNVKENAVFKKIVGSKASIFEQLQVIFPQLNNASIVIKRGEGSDTATINYQDKITPDQLAPLLTAAHKHLRVVERTEKLERLLGDELAEFYRRREEALLRLEGIAQSIIEKNEEYRERIDAELASEKVKLTEQYKNDSEELKVKYDQKEKKLQERENLLNDIKKQIDDRSSKHARRQIRSDLKAALENRAKEFTLTKKTARKRLPIHALFILLMLVTGSFIFKTLLTYNFSSDTIAWWPTVKLSFGAFSFIAAVIFYIRWNDSWFRQHADEEFRLKRLELDIDRASWVVEMALEWNEEEGKEIPAHLIERLTENLFKTQSETDHIKHPSEDLASAIISASSGITLKIPGVGEVAIDRKGIRKIEKELANR
jgi:hypothetical protein